MRTTSRLAERGATSTELAIVYPALLGLVLTMIHFGLLYHANLAVADAADAALEAYQAEGGSIADARSAAAAILEPEGLLREVTVTLAGGPETVAVEVAASSPRLVPGLPTRVARSVMGPVERFIPEPDR